MYKIPPGGGGGSIASSRPNVVSDKETAFRYFIAILSEFQAVAVLQVQSYISRGTM